MVAGRIAMDNRGVLRVGVQKVVDLASDPNRESLWYLEVMDMYNRFYSNSAIIASNSTTISV